MKGSKKQAVKEDQILYKGNFNFSAQYANPKSEDENVLNDVHESLRLSDII